MSKESIKSIDARLDHIQANILKGHGRRFAAHIFFSIKNGGLQSFLEWLPKFDVTSAKQQLEDSERYKRLRLNAVNTNFVQCIYFSYSGYKAAGWEPWAPDNSAFRSGMKSPDRQKLLSDPPVTAWDNIFQSEVHGMILIGHDDQNLLKERLLQLDAQISSFLSFQIQFGRMIRNESGDGIEHFGYVDGISQPLFLEQDINRFMNKNHQPLQWDPSSDADEILLAMEPKTGAQLGSYFVFRKLEQNVKGFKESEEKLAKVLQYEGEAEEIIGAYAVGRFENGTPVLLSGSEDLEDRLTNNFNYDEDELAKKCPYHAHIRKVNPRNAELKRSGGGANNRRLIARRGIPYDDYGRRFLDEENDVIDQSHHPTKDVGLLFMAFMNDIQDQFEFIQQKWANHADGPTQNIGIDPVIGQTNLGNEAMQQWPLTWNSSVKVPADFHGFVTLKGGEYFFAPSLKFLNDPIA
jgi:Dyp-type peroxidase family